MTRTNEAIEATRAPSNDNTNTNRPPALPMSTKGCFSVSWFVWSAVVAFHLPFTSVHLLAITARLPSIFFKPQLKFNRSFFHAHLFHCRSPSSAFTCSPPRCWYAFASLFIYFRDPVRLNLACVCCRCFTSIVLRSVSKPLFGCSYSTADVSLLSGRVIVVFHHFAT